jgi:signal transduction histidine kinase
MSSPWSSATSLWPRVRALLTDRTTWRSVAYLALQLPLGLLTLAVYGSLLAVALSLVAAPLLYVLDAGSPPPDLTSRTLWLGAALAPFHLATLLLLVPLVPVGLAVGVATLHLSQVGARVWRWLMDGLLGMSRAQVELQAAQAEAVAQQARAERLEQSRRELIVNVSHELRTPIASIRGHVDSLLAAPSGGPSEAERLRYLEVVARETERLGSLVDDLLAAARADAGELKLEVTPVQVAEVVEHVGAALAPIARRDRKVTLVTDPRPDVPPTMADRDRLSQVLMNLVRNAIAHTPEGGMVSIRLSEHDDGRVALAVEDTGTGIQPEEVERIFERLYRTDASRSRATGGFGLGLSICRDLVQAMGGTITVASEPGRGSTFSVLLPRAG